MIDAVKYLKTFYRMCSYFGTKCMQCPLSSHHNGKFINCREFKGKYPEKAVEIVEAWAKEHPEKTYTQDLLEKFPTARLGTSNTPLACRREIYGAESPSKCSGDCIDCWEEPMEG